MNISVPDDLAAQVRELDVPISAVCQKALRAAVDNVRQDTGRIVVETGDDYDIKRGFTGRWLVEPDDRETRTGEEGYDAGAYWGVALTRRGRIAVYVAHCNQRWGASLNVYDTLADVAAEVPADIVAQAASALGEDFVIEMDI